MVLMITNAIASHERGKPTYNLTVEVARLVEKELKNPRFAGYHKHIRNAMVNNAVPNVANHVVIRAKHFTNDNHAINYCKQMCNIYFLAALDTFKEQKHENKTSNSPTQRLENAEGENGSTGCTRVNEKYSGRWRIR